MGKRFWHSWLSIFSIDKTCIFDLHV
jgi:hypothetical protein